MECSPKGNGRSRQDLRFELPGCSSSSKLNFSSLHTPINQLRSDNQAQISGIASCIENT